MMDMMEMFKMMSMDENSMNDFMNSAFMNSGFDNANFDFSSKQSQITAATTRIVFIGFLS